MADSGVGEGSGDRKSHPTTPAQQKGEQGSTVDQQNRESDSPKAPQARNTRSTTTPSAAAIQRALSAQRPPASLDGVLEGTKDRLIHSGTNSPSWPTSPRLKSPPPSASRTSSRKDSSDHVQSNTAKRLATVTAPELAAAMLLPEGANKSTSHLRVPARGLSAQNTGLATVVEGSAPSTPNLDPRSDPMASQSDAPSTSTTNSSTPKKETESKTDTSTSKVTTENKSRAPSTSRPPSNLAKRSFTSLTGNKKPVQEPMRSMTVETEPATPFTSSLIDRSRDGGSVRTKTSTETIRPRKEKKKPTRKPGALSGAATSKADVFEAKVANAVDEADTSDSDETFVYESNPPEPRSYRHHSRTPSATSLASTHDHRAKHGLRTGSSAVTGKKSMKFGNSMHNRDYEDGSGLRNPTTRHHHIGKYGRNNHTSLFDNESPFNQARQPASPRTGGWSFKSSRPNSSRVTNGRMTSPRKYGGHAYDNGEDVADDERAPLMGAVRLGRNRHARRPHSRDFRSMEFGEEEESTYWSRFGGCLALIFLLLLVCFGIATFVMAVNRPLFDVEIRKIQNVLASEQELMLDLDVKAVNPNLFAVTVTDLDINLFAESPYVGTTSNWHRSHPGDGGGLRITLSERRKRGWFWPDPPKTHGGVDKGTDPDPDGPDTGVQKMLLGRVYEFDSPLMFDPAPLRRNVVTSVGEIRLAKPGNKTEVGGSARWERVLQHDFDLIVRGVIKYQLPLSSKLRSAKIGSRKRIHPDAEGEDGIHNKTLPAR